MTGIWLVLAGAALAAATAAGAQEGEMMTRSVVSPGDTARLQQVLAKARRGEKVVVGVIGGSITQGAAATKAELTYGSQIARWWRETFPKTEIEFVNAGIGATGSLYGALRVQRDLLCRKPDFVVVEYAVNDPNTEACAETYEGLVRQILKAPGRPAVMLMFTLHQNGTNAQEWQAKVGTHYGLPMISFRDAVWPEIQAGRMKWEEVEADAVHPNDRGHAIMAQLVNDFVAETMGASPAELAAPEVKALPAPLLSDLYETTALYEAGSLAPVRNEGWVLDPGQGWNACFRTDKPGSVLEFEVKGQAVVVMEWHIRGPMGKARMQVDDQPPTVRDAWFDQTWGGWRCVHELARGLAAGVHRVRVELLAERNPQSEGHEFRLLGIGTAGE